MADWYNVQPDEYKYLGKNYTPGRPYGMIGVTIHHMAGDLDADGCNNVWRNREASAHYSVDRNGYIVQHVDDTDRAWACGDGIATRGGNDMTISIEHANNARGPWTVYPAAIESGAHLVAALCRYYGFGRPEWMVNVFPHKYWSSTTCPGELAGSQNAEYMAEAQAYYDEMTGSGHPVNPQQPGEAVNGAGLNYRAHVADYGWLDAVHDGQTAGTTGLGLELEAIKIAPPAGVTLECDIHVADEGWKTYTGIKLGENSGEGSSPNDPIIGTTGKSLRAEAIALRAKGLPEGKKLRYRVHIAEDGWLGWVDAPYTAGTVGISRQIEAIQIAIV